MYEYDGNLVEYDNVDPKKMNIRITDPTYYSTNDLITLISSHFNVDATRVQHRLGGVRLCPNYLLITNRNKLAELMQQDIHSILSAVESTSTVKCSDLQLTKLSRNNRVIPLSSRTRSGVRLLDKVENDVYTVNKLERPSSPFGDVKIGIPISLNSMDHQR